MSGSRYRSISYAEFKSWMDEIGFTEVCVRGMEFAFERSIVCGLTKGQPDRFKVRIMSSVHKETMVTREVGGDAIRILLLDMQPTGRDGDKLVRDWTVYRTAGARQNATERARDAYGYVSKHPEHHCSCGSLMVERKSRGKPFLGCSAFPACKETKQVAA